MKRSVLQLVIVGIFLIGAVWNGYRAFGGAVEGGLSWQRLGAAALLAGVAVAMYFSKTWKN